MDYAELTVATTDLGINLNGHVVLDASVEPRIGGSAVVYRGILGPGKSVVAVKTIRFALHDDKAAVEVRVAQSPSVARLTWVEKHVLTEACLITVSDSGISLVLEWMGMGNASDYVKNSEIDPRPLLLDIASGLYYLHSLEAGPIVHGDLRGCNVLVSNTGRALLTDYGLSTLIDSSFDTSVPAPIHPTVRWMSPEDIESCAKPTVPSDVWGFGMVALELFTRKPPFNEIRSLRTVLARILRGPPDRPSDESTLSRLTDEWWTLCLSCWTWDVLCRPSMFDIGEMFAHNLGNRQF
ncbi:hypothetical protein ID866_3573 [Astraeus odoratus]|nr:hypothetical protein ID866_3573 [Astraeus odoratus]